jgi:phosphatidylglycerol:prolipoprotein diacylglycerol transferase
LRDQLLPYIHIGPLEIPTFGLLMVLAFAAAYFALEGEIKRRKLAFTAADRALEQEGKRRKLMKLDPYTIVAVVAFAGILGAKIWHVIDTPADRLNAETFRSLGALLGWFRGGFAWFGGFVAGIAALLIIARRNGVNMLTMLDISSFAAAVGYAVGRIGCLISGDGDYGSPTSLPWGMSFPNGIVPTTERVHPTPVYEFLASVVIFWILWRIGGRWLNDKAHIGKLFGVYLLLSGVARYLVEIIRINPRVLWGLTNAQLASIAYVIVAAFLLLRTPRIASANRTRRSSQSAA